MKLPAWEVARQPLVSVITPTWNRHDWLFSRCIATVEAQTYPYIEHVIVSDGGDFELDDLLKAHAADRPAGSIQWAFMDNDHRGGQWGVVPRLKALEMAKGSLIAYLDDDDSYRANHIELLVRALAEHPEVGFAYTRMASHGAQMEPPGGNIIGGPELGPCGIGTPMLMHRRELLKLATWGPPNDMEDWRLVDRWLGCDVKAWYVPEVTVDVWPSAYRGGNP